MEAENFPLNISDLTSQRSYNDDDDDNEDNDDDDIFLPILMITKKMIIVKLKAKRPTSKGRAYNPTT